jgi:O-antigen ligase
VSVPVSSLIRSKLINGGFAPALILAFALAVYLTASVTSLPLALAVLPLVAGGLMLSLVNSEDVDRVRLQHPRLLLALSLFLISLALTTILSYDPHSSLNACMVVFPGLLIAYMLTQLEDRYCDVFTWGLVGMVFTASVVCIVMFLKSPYSDAGAVFYAGKTPALVVPNDMVLGVIFAPVVIQKIFSQKVLALKAFAVLTLLLLASALYLVKSRICFLTGVVIFLLYLHHFHRKNFLGLLLLSVVAFVTVDFVAGLNIANDLILLLRENTRLSVWYAGFISVSQHPVVGYGPSQFYIAYEQVMATTSLPAWIMIDPRTVPWAHNMYLDALVERGVIGLFALLFLVYQIYIRLAERSDRSKGSRHYELFAIYAAFIGFLFAGFFELTIQRIWVANGLFIFIGFAFMDSAKMESAADTGK